MYLDVGKIRNDNITGALDYFTIHEYQHAIMLVAGIAVEKHHCIIGIQRIPIFTAETILSRIITENMYRPPPMLMTVKINDCYNRL